MFVSATYASRHFNVSLGHVCSSARGDRGSTGGYIFRYIDDDGNIIYNDTFANIKETQTYLRVLAQYK